MARAKARLACSMEGPSIEPDVSMTKMTSRAMREAAASSVGGMTIAMT